MYEDPQLQADLATAHAELERASQSVRTVARSTEDTVKLVSHNHQLASDRAESDSMFDNFMNDALASKIMTEEQLNDAADLGENDNEYNEGASVGDGMPETEQQDHDQEEDKEEDEEDTEVMVDAGDDEEQEYQPI
jgi:hypothetical protein